MSVLVNMHSRAKNVTGRFHSGEEDVVVGIPGAGEGSRGGRQIRKTVLMELEEAAENTSQEDTAVHFHHLQTLSPHPTLVPASVAHLCAFFLLCFLAACTSLGCILRSPGVFL